jgi:CBS domain-containing protein
MKTSPVKEDKKMSCIAARDIMHPKVSLPAKTTGESLVQKLMSPYPALPVVNDKQEVIGIVSEYDVLDALKEGRTVHEFSAESIMSCGHIDHADVCTKPVTVTPETPIEDVVEIFFGQRISVIPVVEKKKLVGVIGRKNIINALAEKGFWKEHEFKKRV